MSFQFLFDNAAEIMMDIQPVVAQSITRNNAVKSVSRGGDTWRFTVNMPSGLRWEDVRPIIAKMEILDRYTQDTVQINNSGYNSWLTKYQGDSDATTTFTVDFTSGNTVEISAYPTGHNLTAGEYTFKAGDLIQMGATGKVYKVAADVVYPATTITLNRAVIEGPDSYQLNIGPTVSWGVVCVSFPTHTIFDRNLVRFNGPFIFYEVV